MNLVSLWNLVFMILCGPVRRKTLQSATAYVAYTRFNGQWLSYSIYHRNITGCICVIIYLIVAGRLSD